MTGKTIEEFMAEIKKNCESVVKDELLLIAIARAEGITMDWSTYKNGARGYLQQYIVFQYKILKRMLQERNSALQFSAI